MRHRNWKQATSGPSCGMGTGNKPRLVHHVAWELKTRHVWSIMWHGNWKPDMFGPSCGMGTGNQTCLVHHVAWELETRHVWFI
ncbi:unnamed protein product, partial [Staurois parvus]